jgi:hypothetical protein
MDALAALLGRVGVVASLLTALLLSAVLAANVAVLGLGYPPDTTLALFLQATPVICLFLGNLATLITFYGSYRILRRKDEYNVRDDLKGHAADLPGRLQGLPAQLARQSGCVGMLSATTLAASLVVTGLTLAPQPFRGLGVVAVGAGYQPARLGSTVMPTAPTPTPTPSRTPTPIPVVKFAVAPTQYTQDCNTRLQPNPQTITLDNTGSTRDVAWSVAMRESVGVSAQAPWAKPSQTHGVISAGQTAQITLTTGEVDCLVVPNNGTRDFHADFTLAGSRTVYTVTDTITGQTIIT